MCIKRPAYAGRFFLWIVAQAAIAAIARGFASARRQRESL
jgi:hypothetical protein